MRPSPPPPPAQVTVMHPVEELGGPKHVPGPHTPASEYVKYKYLLAIDGSTAAYRWVGGRGGGRGGGGRPV